MGKPDDDNIKYCNIIFRVIDYKPKISLEGGEVLAKIKGDIEFVDATFKYPGSENPVLKNINMKINKGECVALVGEIGCGKSTLIQLILRFYDCS